MGTNYIVDINGNETAASFTTAGAMKSATAAVTGELVVGGATNTAPSAVLEVISITKGFRPPVMSSAQRTAITTPDTGIIVYDSTLNQWCGYDGSAWVILG